MTEKKSKGTEFARWMGPLLECLRAVGGSSRPREVSGWIARELKLPESITDATIKSGANRFHNQVQWARQYLVWEGLLDDSERGVWKLTPLGWRTHIDEGSAERIFRDRVKASRALPDQTEDKKLLPIPASPDSPTPHEEKEVELLAVLKSLPPYGFELICGRLLHEHGFENVEVTQRSRDGGIDGYGLLRLSPFVSLRVAFQAKRFKNVVSRSAVGEFRNAFLGRAEKGVFITTGRFTTDAQSEASRDGVVPIELIDGEQLVLLFQDANIGVKPKTVYTIDHAFFDEFRRQSSDTA